MKRILCVAVCLFALGCGSTTREDRSEQQDRVLVRTTEEVRQELVDGQMVELRTKTRVVEDEQTDREANRNEVVEVTAPKILDAVRPLAHMAATAVAGPGGGAAVDWLWQTVAGVGAAGTTAGVGVVLRERSRRRLMVKSQDAYANDLESAETEEDVAAVKRKHSERQKALGIHDALARERHSA